MRKLVKFGFWIVSISQLPGCYQGNRGTISLCLVQGSPCPKCAVAQRFPSELLQTWYAAALCVLLAKQQPIVFWTSDMSKRQQIFRSIKQILSYMWHNCHKCCMWPMPSCQAASKNRNPRAFKKKKVDEIEYKQDVFLPNLIIKNGWAVLAGI